MMLVGIGVWLRALPARLAEAGLRQTTLTITVKNDDTAFTWVKEWLLEQDFIRLVRSLDLDTTLRGEEMALLPAPGSYWFWRRGRPVQVTVAREAANAPRRARVEESFTFRTPGRNPEVLRALVEEIAAAHRRKLRGTSHLYVFNDGWERVAGYLPRSLEAVILPPNEKERLLEDMVRFLGSQERYRRLGIPYHRGYAFFGPPGTGKTSLVSALAAHFAMSVYCINLVDFNDRTLKAAMLDVGRRSVVLFEDIDAMAFGGRRPTGAEAGEKPAAAAHGGVTLSGLLNALDGLHAPQEVIFVMTTNALDRLDAALLRPGRIDYRLFLAAAGDAQKMALHRRFYPQATEAEARSFAHVHRDATMAEIQNALLGAGEGERQQALMGVGSRAATAGPA